MIFIIHYFLYNMGLPAIITMIALFVQTYSDASLSEIGSLLMVLPFIMIIIKPLIGALADRQQAHRLYLTIALALMALGYGSLCIAPFFPDFAHTHGRLVWYIDIVGIVIGYSSFGVVWSLGDALAMNHAQMAGVTWGTYRVWGVVGWGVGGVLSGQINELSFLPKYVPAMLLLLMSLIIEIVLIAFWPNKHFIMGGSLSDTVPVAVASTRAQSIHSKDSWSSAYLSSIRSTGSLRASQQIIGAMAGVVVEELSGTLRSSLKLDGHQRNKRAPLDEIFRDECQQAACIHEQASNGVTTASLSKATAPRASIALNELTVGQQPSIKSSVIGEKNVEPCSPILSDKSMEMEKNKKEAFDKESDQFKSADELQIIVLKMIVRRDKTIWKYLIMFTIFGALLIVHLSYFFLHLAKLCHTEGVDFSLVSGAMLAAQALSEVFAFTVVVPYLVPWAGRAGALLACVIFYGLRFGYYGFYLETSSPYTGIPFEMVHGIVYGIVYSLITDIACESVDQVDRYFPELVQRGLVEPSLSANQLKVKLRATMQGLFSAVFDGLGIGMGALFGGLFLDSYGFAHLWRCCTYICVVMLVVYLLTEWRALFGRRPHATDELEVDTKLNEKI